MGAEGSVKIGLPDLSGTDAVVERLRAEGDLVRNTGTNSIKAVIGILKEGFSFSSESLMSIERSAKGIQEAVLDNNRLIWTALAVVGDRVGDFFDYVRERDSRKDFRDAGARRGPSFDPSKAVEGEKIDWKDALSDKSLMSNLVGAAFVAYALDLDKYVRAVFIPQVAKSLTSALASIARAMAPEALIQKTVRSVTAAFSSVRVFAVETATRLSASIKSGVSAAVRSVDSFLDAFGLIGAQVKLSVSTMAESVKPLASTLSSMGRSVMSTVTRMAGYLVNFGKILGNVAIGFGKAIPIVGNLFRGITRLVGFLRAVPVIGQLLTVVFGVFDFVKGFIRGFKSQDDALRGILAGLGEGIVEAIKGMIMKPLDLLIDLAAVIVEKLGFKDFAQKMKDFSLEEMFDSFVESIKAFFSVPLSDRLTDVMEAVVGWTEGISSAIGEAVSGFVSQAKEAVLGYFVLPAKDKVGTLFESVMDQIREMVKIIRDWFQEKVYSLLNFLGVDPIMMGEEERKRAIEEKVASRRLEMQDELDRPLTAAEEILLREKVTKEVTGVEPVRTAAQEKILGDRSSQTRVARIESTARQVERMKSEPKSSPTIVAPQDNSVRSSTVVNNTYSSPLNPRSSEHSFRRAASQGT